jgi:hypothetical protein
MIFTSSQSPIFMNTTGGPGAERACRANRQLARALEARAAEAEAAG